MASEVVEISEPLDGVLQITMQDTLNKNTFSDELTQGLINAFEYVSENQKFRVVILTGYDSYFASGGTQEALLSLSNGEGRFSDRDLYSLALHCPVPVISAMQGHGIGGGFAMGLFADFIILSRESIYTANFMKYGFTPGMGATYILPLKLGISLAEEMLISARNYRGEELKERGIAFPVLPRKELIPYALDLASTITEKPRVSLVALKTHLVSRMREELSHFIDKELAMHELTFHNPEVRKRIETLFGN